MKQPCRAFAMALLLSSAASAQGTADVSTAREVAKQGLQAFDAGNYVVAEAQLARAYAVVKVPTIALYRARALVKLGRLVEAAELYLEASRLEATGAGREEQEKAKQTALAEREALLPRIPKVVILVQGADASTVSVEIDGSPIPSALFMVGRLVDPGKHTVVGRSGAGQIVEEVVVKEGEKQWVRLSFEAAPAAAQPAASAPAMGPGAPPPSTSTEPPPDRGADGALQRTLGWVGIGIGGAGVLIGGVTGLVAMSQQGKLDDGGCQDGVCYDDQADDVDSYNSMRTLSTVGFVVGGVGLAAGVALLLTAPPDQEAQTTAYISPWLGLGSAGVAGRF